MGDKISELGGQIEELKWGLTPEAVAMAKQRATNLEVEVAQLKSELADAKRDRAMLRE